MASSEAAMVPRRRWRMPGSNAKVGPVDNYAICRRESGKVATQRCSRLTGSSRCVMSPTWLLAQPSSECEPDDVGCSAPSGRESGRGRVVVAALLGGYEGAEAI